LITLRTNDFELKGIELVIFDKDGTIFDIHKYWSFVISKRAEYFSNLVAVQYKKDLFGKLIETMGLLNNGLIRNTGPIGIKSRRDIVELIYRTLQQLIPKISTADVEKGFLEVDSIVDRQFNNILGLLPGVEEKIVELHSAKCFVSLATSDVSSRAIRALKHVDLYKNFDCILCSDQVENPKPAIDMVDEIMNKLNCQSKNNIVLIGDSLSDLEMAKNSGIHFIGVGTGLNSSKFISQSNNFVESLVDMEILSEKC
jgi:HAD superfamily hydrolase (TIGR01509 family)